MKEALRLYPPIQKIRRESNGERRVVDVEATQRDLRSWGADALSFDPMRWHQKQTSDKDFMAFGVGVLSCPTREF